MAPALVTTTPSSRRRILGQRSKAGADDVESAGDDAMSSTTSKKFRASVDDASFDVEVTGDVVQVSDTQFVVAPRGQAIDVKHSSTDAPDSAPVARAFVAIAGDVTWVCIDGEVFTIDVEDAQRMRRPRAAAGEGLSAPMPATVIRVIAEPGREVKRGETLLLLEAMKMELPVRAPRDGKVKAVHCQAGQLVQPGVPLVDLE
jgi:biotin carboxyl carrier protein